MQGCVIWLTGLPSSGKTTIASALAEQLHYQATPVVVLDGDDVRCSLSADLGFSPEDRLEQNRRVVCVSKLLIASSNTVIVPLISPYRAAREFARRELDRFIEVYVKCPIEECILRDPKGLYAKAVRGEITDFTGISAPYEEPEHPEVTVETNVLSVKACVERILEAVRERGYQAISPASGNLALEPAQESHDQGLELTVLMPCLNESEAIVDCVNEARRAIDAANVTGEVLVVDNGSTDGSAELALQAGARVVYESRKGYGSAYLRGFKEARGKYIIIGDADGTYDYSLIPQFLARFREGYDFINGSRINGSIAAGAMPFLHRYVGVPILSWLLNRFSGAKLSDAHCGMRGFTREAVEKMELRTPGMEFASEIILQAARAKLHTCELPVPYGARRGKSKLRTFSDGWRHLRFMLLYSPTHLFFVPGAFSFALGLAILLALVWGTVRTGGMYFGIHYMVVGSLLALLGYQVAMLGIYGRAYALSIGVLKRDHLILLVKRYLTLERGLLFGALVTFFGLGLLSWILATWVARGFSFQSSPLLRPALVGMTLVLIGIQIIFSSFFMSLLSMKFQGRSKLPS